MSNIFGNPWGNIVETNERVKPMRSPKTNEIAETNETVGARILLKVHKLL